MDKVLIELLEAKKKEGGTASLQGLHTAFGFDFNKPLKAVTFTDSFTATSLKKDYGIDVKDERVAVIFYRYGSFKLAEFTGGKCSLINNYEYGGFSTIWTKSDFDEMRKDGYLKVFVIAQAGVYLFPRVRSNEEWKRATTLDPFTRYRPYNDTYRRVYRYDVAKRWYNAIDVSSDSHFDASGYPVFKKREDLENRAKRVKAERNAKAYKEMTNTKDMIKKAKEAIERKKIEMSKRLLDCNNAHDISVFGSNLTRFSGLYGCYCDIENIEEKDNEKRFASPDAFNKAIADIYDTLARI